MNKKRKWMSFITMAIILTAMSGSVPYFSTTGEAVADAPDKQDAAAKSATAAAGTAQTAAAEHAETAPKPAVTAAGSAQPQANLYPITATKQVAENGRLRLFIDPKSGNVRVVDKQTNAEWLGEPQVDRKTLPNNKSFMDSPVHVRYTDGVDVVQTYTLKDKQNQLTIQPIDGGVRESFELPNQQISFSIEIRLRDDGLEATIPFNSIKEQGKSHLVSLEPLPFFNAATENDRGALFVPDGSGALIEYRSNHAKYFAGYSQPIYGPDYTYATQTNDKVNQAARHVMSPREYIALPVFGNYKNRIGYAGVVTAGEEDALINGTPAGIRNIPLYRTSVEFVYRKNDVVFIGSSGDVPLFQGGLVEGDRTVRYVLLQGDEAGYVGMAKAYRQFLTSEKKLSPVNSNAMPLNVTLFGGILRDEVIGKTYIAMTTFEQARKVIDAYAQKGVTNLQLTLEGWSKDGMYGNQPEHFPVDKHLGGMSDLQDLAAYAKQKGVALYLRANYVRPYSESDGISKNNDAIRGLDRNVAISYNYWVSNGYSKRQEQFYWMKPDTVYDNHIAGESDDYARLGIAGVDFQYMGDTLYSDQDTHHLFSRQQTAGVWVKALDTLRKKVGKTAVDYGFAYTLGHVDHIDNAPLDNSHFTVTDKPVPFYQIALHGLVPYSAKASNLRDDAQTEFLRALEYGAQPSYELTYEPTANLQRTMEDRLISSSFDYWLDPSVKEYETFRKLNEAVGKQPIVNHEQLSKYVFRTTYGDGTQVIVNYDTAPAAVDGTNVEGLGFAIRKGGQ